MKYHLHTDVPYEENSYFGSFNAVDDDTAGQYAIDWLIENEPFQPEKDTYKYEVSDDGIHINVLVGGWTTPDLYVLLRDKEI